MSDRMTVDLAHVRARPDQPQWLSAWRSKERWYARWEREFSARLGELDAQAADGIREAVAVAQRAQGRVQKDDDREEFRARLLEILREVIDALFHGYREGEDAGAAGAAAAYTGLALDEGADAGQSTLDALGLNRTFAWAGQRDFVGDAFSVRGSKIITRLYGNHRAELARMVVDATRPESPRTIAELTAEIRAAWSRLTAYEARRIAQTEAGIVWERTNWYAMRANGVRRVRWLVAHGPAIGVRVGPVCPKCMAMAAGSPYDMDSLGEIPPKHPFCRCTLVPMIDSRWLPPAQPWTGSEAPLPTFGLDEAGGRTVPTEVTVFKSGRRWGAEAPADGWSAAPGRGWMI